MKNEEIKALAEMGLNSIEPIKKTGMRILEIKQGYAKLLLPIKGNINHVGIMYAGSLFTLGEVPGGILYISAFDMNKFFPIVKEVNIRFRRPAKTDVTLEAKISKDKVEEIEKEAEINGKADFSLEMDIKDAEEETVSIVNGIWQIRKMEKGAATI
jgi:acyl-coenzyme A thioesterase PaaI-like protein